MPDLHPAWQRVFDGLERDRDEANRRADRLQATLDRMADAMAKQGDELKAIRKMLRRREAQLKKAEREARKYRRALGLDDPDPDPDPEPDAAPVPSDDDIDVDSDEVDDADFDDGGPKASTAEASEATPRPRRSSGRRPPPDHLPIDVEHHAVCACEMCGSHVLKRDVLVKKVYSVVPTHLRVREIRRERVLCTNPSCGQATTASSPPMPCDRALYDCAFIAWVVTMKFAFLMPLDRIQSMLASQGASIAMGTLVHLVERATALADAVDGEHMKQLRAGTYICFDGTGLKVLMPGQDRAWDGYLEVFAREELTVFQFDLTKHADALRDRLSKVEAVLVTDAETRNKAGAPGAVFAHCNAHVVRALREAEKVQPFLAREGRAFLDGLYANEAEAKALGLTGEALWAHRQEGRPILDRFERWLREVANGDLPPSDPVRKVANYCLRHWDGLTRFMDDPDLPLDNNAAEREFQRHAKLRFASLFAGSEEGAHRWATLLGVVRTAQKHDLDVQAYLTWMFERRGTHRQHFGLSAAQLTPAAYKAAGCPGAITERLPIAA